jgi:hypothetical protein
MMIRPIGVIDMISYWILTKEEKNES